MERVMLMVSQLVSEIVGEADDDVVEEDDEVLVRRRR